jgi:ATP-dependent DNA helicase RecG
MPAKERADVVQLASDGNVDILVGTHALFQDSVRFKRLGLAVVDEQHRFGVAQRSALHGKGKFPHLLVMTATPIPRSLTLTVYGDLDISVIDELPPGRKPIRTHWKKSAERDRVYQTLDGLLDQGRQAYVICSRVDESEKSALKAVKAYHLHLSENVLPKRRIGLMHGQMKRQEKDAVMTSFRNGELDILIATTVVEVGVDVPNASVIVIEDAHRFGLSQLHQLRGRVGRGATKSFCILIGDGETQTAERRLRTMTESTDGFQIAEEDLKLRGPGDYFGTRQSGAPEVPFMELSEGLRILEAARETAIRIVENGMLETPEGSLLRGIIERKQQVMAGFAAH